MAKELFNCNITFLRKLGLRFRYRQAKYTVLVFCFDIFLFYAVANVESSGAVLRNFFSAIGNSSFFAGLFLLILGTNNVQISVFQRDLDLVFRKTGNCYVNLIIVIRFTNVRFQIIVFRSKHRAKEFVEGVEKADRVTLSL